MPDISVIIPTLNRAELLDCTLRSVAAVLGGADSTEIIVVDNGSTDGTAEVFSSVQGQFPSLRWRYCVERVPGLLSGRHRGASEARGEVLAFLDDDVLLSPSWLDALQEAFRNPAVALVGGPCLPKYAVDPPTWLAALWEQTEFGRMCPSLSLIDLGQTRRPVDPLCVFGLNFAIRKEVFRKCGGFHPDCIPKLLQRYQGDGETGLSFKIREKGLTALYDPHAAVEHVIPASRLTVDSLRQRAFYQGVCDSYTQIRRDRVVAEQRGRTWRDALRPLRLAFSRTFSSAEQAIRVVFARAHAAGVTFHRNEVRRDRHLLEWVLKPDYFDYALPAEWETYARR